MAGTAPELPQAETQRQELLSRCNDAIGGGNPVLTEVLSFFPEQAELFIRTQNYAAQIEGKKGVWLNIRHKDGRWENLGVHGYTGENVTEVIQDIHALHGEEWMGEHPFSALPENIKRILSVVDKEQSQLTVWDRMIQKTLDIMKVGPEDIGLLREYYEGYRASEALRKQADEMRRKADALVAQGQEKVRAVQETINDKYPRKPSSKEK
jgi:hypothetical protein